MDAWAFVTSWNSGLFDSGLLDSLVWCNQRSRLRGTWPRWSHTQDSQTLCDSCSYWCTWARAVSWTAMSYGGGGQRSGWGHTFILDVNISFTFKRRVHAEAQTTQIKRCFYLPSTSTLSKLWQDKWVPKGRGLTVMEVIVSVDGGLDVH